MVWFLIVLAILVAITAYDLIQRKHSILRNFPIIGHFRYWFETVGPELRQYIVTSNDEERPFSRDQRRWVYASSKRENNYFGFGTDNDVEYASNYLILHHAAFPLHAPHAGEPGYDPNHKLPCVKVLGQHRGRKHAFRPSSIINVSGMSFGSLSANAISAINRGCHIAGALHNTGEGGISPYHLQGGDLIWQIGTGYFGCRDEDGHFSLERLRDTVAQHPVKAIEIKLSQGAKPGKGGVLPMAKITREIAAIRGIPMGRDCISPAAHSAFRDVDSLLDFVESIAEATGLPVGIKSAVGNPRFWRTLTDLMSSGDRGVDFIVIDGGEGGTGAAPLAFSDHMALPFKHGFSRVYRQLVRAGIQDHVVLVGSGKLGFPESGMLALAMGCDMIHVAREAMLAIGCIQAQRCHTGHCPAGVATQSRWLMRGLDPADKASRLANYVTTLRKELLELSHAMGYAHPALVPLAQFEILDGGLGAQSAATLFGYEDGWGIPGPSHIAALRADWAPASAAHDPRHDRAEPTAA